MAKKIKVTQIKSAIKCFENQKRTIKALGFKKLRHTVTHADTPAIRGMINTVKHLVHVEDE